jgi:hypothetical protein
MMMLSFGFDFYVGLSRLVLVFSMLGLGVFLFWFFQTIYYGLFASLEFLVWFILALIALFGIFFLH